MRMNIYKEDMELIEKALRHEVELLKMMNHDSLLGYDLLCVENFLFRWNLFKDINGYGNIHQLIW